MIIIIIFLAIIRIITPNKQAEQPRQPFARCALSLFRARQVQCRIGVEPLLPRPLQLVEVAHPLTPSGAGETTALDGAE